jgi:hypothetical protein
MLWVRISIRARCTTLCDKVCQWLDTGQRFSPGPPLSSTNKTDHHNITQILLKVTLNTITPTLQFQNCTNIKSKISFLRHTPQIKNKNLNSPEFLQLIPGFKFELWQRLKIFFVLCKIQKLDRILPHSGEVYSIQHYVIKFVSDLWQVCGFLRVLCFPPPIKLTTTI